MSEVLDKIKSRRSIRKYRSDMIPQDKLEKIIEAGTYAATGMGKQSPIIIAVTNKELREKSLAPNHAPTFWKCAILSDFCNRLILKALRQMIVFC